MDKFTQLFDRDILAVSDKPETAKNNSPCPVCTIRKKAGESLCEDIKSGDHMVKKVMLRGRTRATWVHNKCAEYLSVAEDVQQEQQAQGVADQGIKESPKSLDGVIATIASFEGRKAAYQAVMDIGPGELHVHQGDGNKAIVKGAKHACFDQAVKLSVNREPIFLIGPTGSGKSYMARQVAQATLRRDGEELPYSEVPCSAGISEGHLMGKLLPTGEQGSFEFHHAALSGAYAEGGFCTLEEIDGSDPNTLLCVNSALAGEEMALPNNPTQKAIDRHEDFVLCLIGNTWGMGADRIYVGRAQLDYAFLDRFALNVIEVDYDKKLEQVLCPDQELLEMLWTWRTRISDNKLRRIVSTRTVAKWYKYQHELGISKEDLLEAYFGGWSEDERQLVEHGKKEDDNDE